MFRLIAKNRTSLRLAAILLIGGTLGCYSSTHGTRIDRTQVDLIKKGVTTRAEVESMFGPPANMMIMGDGKRQAMWQYVETDAQADGKSFIPIYGVFAGGAKATSKTQSLQVIYTKDEIVDDFVFSGGTSETESSNSPFGHSSKTRTTAAEPASGK